MTEKHRKIIELAKTAKEKSIREQFQSQHSYRGRGRGRGRGNWRGGFGPQSMSMKSD
jgi:hypothetical protein